MTIGTLSNDDDDDGSENVAKKTNLRPFKLNRVYLDPLNMETSLQQRGAYYFTIFLILALYPLKIAPILSPIFLLEATWSPVIQIVNINPCFTNLRFINPRFVTPCFTDPCFINPCFTDPCFINPCFIDSCFINPVHVSPIQYSPYFIVCHETIENYPCVHSLSIAFTFCPLYMFT